MLFFFFFKQKTAYEMRISDWSSDVCSSDLLVDKDNRRGDGARALEQPRDLLLALAIPFRQEVRRFDRDEIGVGLARRGLGQQEIGRASCGERVCQYVSISVVAGALKKIKKKQRIIQDDRNKEDYIKH